MNPRLVARQCARSVPLLRAKEEISMARKVGQIIARGDRRWLIRVYLGRDRETQKRKYHNRTIHGPMREAQAYLTRKLRERDLGRDLEGAKITLNEYLDRWIQTAVKPRVREKTWQDYEGMLRRYIRPHLGETVLAAMRPLDLQTTYQQMIEWGLSARTVRYTHVVLRSAMRQALQWRLLHGVWQYCAGKDHTLPRSLAAIRSRKYLPQDVGREPAHRQFDLELVP